MCHNLVTRRASPQRPRAELCLDIDGMQDPPCYFLLEFESVICMVLWVADYMPASILVVPEICRCVAAGVQLDPEAADAAAVLHSFLGANWLLPCVAH